MSKQQGCEVCVRRATMRISRQAFSFRPVHARARVSLVLCAQHARERLAVWADLRTTDVCSERLT